MSKRFFFTIIFSFFSFSLFSETLSFPVKGLVTVSPLPIFISAEWEDAWISEKSSFDYNHNLARVASVLASVSYTDVQDSPESNLMGECYKLLGADKSSFDFHYDVDYSAPNLGDNQAAFSFASKKIKSKSENKTLVFVVIRGTPLNANEWISNLSINDETKQNTIIHEGFYKTMTQIRIALENYLKNQKIAAEEACFLITGHSRGAAVANLLGSYLAFESKFDTSKIFVYTFASPNVSQALDTNDAKYGFIWNILNGEDIVPTVPPYRNGWKFGKYGNNKIIINRWSAGKQKYEGNFYPKMNTIFSQFMIRDYCPFKNGTFVQSQISRVLTSFYPDVNSYYEGRFKLRNSAEKILWKIFPSKKGDANEEIEKQKNTLFNNISYKINEQTEGGVDYVKNAFVDMHASETYLSWLFALDENDAFSDAQSVQLVLDGYYECAVFDLDGNLLARIIDGVPQYENIKVPIAAMPLPSKKTALGFPLNEEFDVVIYKPSLIPTKIKTQIEIYNAEGHLLKKTENHNVYPHIGVGLTFKAGKILIEDEKITEAKIKKQILKDEIKAGKLRQEDEFHFKPEFSVDIDKNLSGGFNFGTKRIYGLALFSAKNGHFGEFFSFSSGIGHQNYLYGNILLNSEFLGKCVWIFDDESVDSKSGTDSDRFSFVPAARFSISFQPVHRFEFFVTGVFDFEIGDLNESFFASKIQSNKIGKINLCDSVKIVPTVSFGVKF